MKYGINRYDNSEVINSYIKSDNSIIIIYLDESVKEIPYSEDNENKVLNEMIIQAIVREETELNQLPIKIKYDFLNIVSRAVISFLMFSSIYTNRYYYVNKSVVYKIVYSLVVACTKYRRIYCIKQFKLWYAKTRFSNTYNKIRI